MYGRGRPAERKAGKQRKRKLANIMKYGVIRMGNDI